jgi:hypothetical protein
MEWLKYPALPFVAAYSIYALVVYTTGVQMPYIPVANSLAAFIPLLVMPSLPLTMWKGPVYAGVYYTFVALYLCLQFSLIVIYSIGIFVPSVTIEPVGPSSPELLIFRQVAAGVALAIPPLVSVYILAYKRVPEEAKREDALGGMDYIVHTTAWLVAWLEVSVSFFSLPTSIPVWVAVDSSNAVLISAVLIWAYNPIKSVESGPRMAVFMGWLALGLAVSISAWIYDVLQVESVATYLDANGYRDIFVGNTSVLIRNKYRYVVEATNIPNFAVASASHQLVGVMWIVVGGAVLAIVLERRFFDFKQT